MTDATDDDQLLRERLRALDPAGSLPPADREALGRLLREIASDEHDAELPETRQTGVHERSRLTWVVAAAAVVLMAGAGVVALLQRDTDDPPAAHGGSADHGSPTVTTLSAPPGAVAARCAVPSADVLAEQDLAFDAVVDDVDDDVVTLRPRTFYAGEATDLVRVESPPEVLRDLLLAVSFAEGGRYLVSALDGQVSVCGYSGEWSPRLERLYVEAFTG